MGFTSPFQVLTRQMTLKARDRRPPGLGPEVRVDTVQASPAAAAAGLEVLIRSAGLSDRDRDGLKEQSTATNCMWLGPRSPDLWLEFELPEPVALGGLEVWNYNAEWQTDKGVRQADLAVSADGMSWQTVQRSVELAEAEGTADYDQPAVVKLNGVLAKKVRLLNLAPWNGGAQVGLSKVVFHEAPGKRAGALRPEDGAEAVNADKAVLEWQPGQDAREHRVFLGVEPGRLEPVGRVKEPRFQPVGLKPEQTYFWRVDEVQADGSVVAGRVCKFTAGRSDRGNGRGH